MKDYQNYDAHTLGLGSGINIFFNKGLFHLGINYENRKASQKTATKFVDASFISSDISILYPLTKHINIKTNYLFRKGFYNENIDTITKANNKERDDNFHKILLKLSYEFNRKTAIYMQGIYSNNSTNYTLTRYKQNIVSVGFSILY